MPLHRRRKPSGCLFPCLAVLTWTLVTQRCRDFAVMQRSSQKIPEQRQVHAMTMDVLLKMDEELLEAPSPQVGRLCFG